MPGFLFGVGNKYVVPPANPIITIKEARKLLGKEAADLSDTEIMKLIETMSKIADLKLDQVLAKGQEHD